MGFVALSRAKVSRAAPARKHAARRAVKAAPKRRVAKAAPETDEARIVAMMRFTGYDRQEASAAVDRAKGLSAGCRKAEK
jgi:hypothetical protein